MHLETQFEAIFNSKRGPKRGASWRPYDAVWDWENLGFSGIYSAWFFLSISGRQRWLANKAVLFPNQCCNCSASATHLVDFRPYLRIPFVHFRSRTAQLHAIPHCEDHVRDDPRAFGRVSDERAPFASVQLFSRNRPFLEACLVLNDMDGDLPPPWVAFPAAHPAGGFNQGTNQAWMTKAWRPFWARLSAAERTRYLAEWPPPSVWRERFTLLDELAKRQLADG